MNTYLKYKPVWFRVMIMGSLLSGAFLIMGFLAAFLVVKLTNLPLTDNILQVQTPEMLKVQKLLMLAQALLIFIIPALVYGYLSDPRPMHFLRLDVKPTSKYILIAVIVILIAIPSSFWLGELNKHLDLSHTLPGLDKWIKAQESDTNALIDRMVQNQSITDLFVNLILMALLPAIGEELIFRGLLQKGLIRITRNVWVGIILSAFIFSAIHFQFLTFLARFELGIILGALFWYSGSLWVSIAAHFAFNGLQVVLSYCLPHADETPPALVSAKAAGISFLIVILLLIIIKRMSTVSMSEVYDDDEDDFIIELDNRSTN